MDFRTIFTGLAFLSLTACADTAASLPSIEFSNPFAMADTVTAVYTSRFNDIPIPTEMKSATAKTFVSGGANGEPVGVETVAGRVDAASLLSSMQKLMRNQGWAQKGMCVADDSLAVFTKGSRTAVLSIVESALTTTMRIWVVEPLSSAALPKTQTSMYPGDTNVDSPETSKPVNSVPLAE